MVGTRFRLKSRRAVLKELFLPAVEDRGLEPVLVTQLRDRHLLQQMPPQDGDFLFRRLGPVRKLVEQVDTVLFYTGAGVQQRYPAAVSFFVAVLGRADAAPHRGC